MIRNAFLKLIKLYQATLSPDHGFIGKYFYPHGCCKFYPTCSDYGYQAIERFGTFKGIWLGSKRVLRCNPLSEGGIDEIPSSR
ncbi:membrane protein insertion efficiency factor YidD [Patescibacteria group bacterium]